MKKVVVFSFDSYADPINSQLLLLVTGGIPAPVSHSSLPAATKGLLPASGVDEIVVVGGTAAVSDAVVNQIKGLTGNPKVTRLAGADRYSTNALVQSYLSTLPPISTTPPPPTVVWPIPGGIDINPGDNWQTKANAAGAGTSSHPVIFNVRDGTHTNATVIPKDYQHFIGNPDRYATQWTGTGIDSSRTTGLKAIMDGGGVTSKAFDASNSVGVVIGNLQVQNYNPPGQYGCIEQTNNGGHTTHDWTIYNCDVHDSGYGGIGIGTNTLCRDSRMHHNAFMGATSAFSTGAHWLRCEVDHNHPGTTNPYVEASGSKCAETTSLTWESCYVHDNSVNYGGPGLWTDINNIYTTYKNNLITNNGGPGIFHEISYDYSIHDNTITGNGIIDLGWVWSPGILIAASGGSSGEIYNNFLDLNRHGISLIQQSRGSGTYGPYYVQNNNIHNNTIKRCTAYSGAVQDVGDKAIFTSRNNVFDYNAYVSHPANHWAWDDGDRSFATWQGTYGLDTHGSSV